MSATQNLRLWFRQPASDWLEALPVGNGRLGAMVFGTYPVERVQLNEETVWSGGPIERNNPATLEALGEVRRLLFAGKVAEAEELAEAKMFGIPRQIKPSQTLGDLFIEFEGHDRANNYRRELDLDRAIVATEYRIDDVRFCREVFASAPDQVVVMWVSASRNAQINCTLHLTREADATVQPLAPNQLLMQGKLDAGEGMRIAALLRALPRGGKIQVEDDCLYVRGADELLILLAAATDYRGGNPVDACKAALDAAGESSYEVLRDRHIASHRELFGRVELSLSNTEEVVIALPTDERMARLKKGEADEALLALYFHFGRYLLIASSGPAATLPTNLQGLWNDSLKPAWDCDYHLNINLQMNYWPTEVCGLEECHRPLFDFLQSLREPGHKTAHIHYGCRGFVAHHLTDIFGFTVPQGHVGWGLWPMGAAWLCDHLWEHYRFTLDRAFLETRAYPILKEAAEFFVDYLTPDPQGHWVTGPSLSPENHFLRPDGQPGSLCMGPTMDLEIVRALFEHCIAAAKLLGRDGDFAARLTDMLTRLAPLRIGTDGRLQEWPQEYEEFEPGHRHASHLYALHPGNQIDLDKTPELAQAARKSLEHRLAQGGGQTGWSRAWLVNFYARLRECELAHASLIDLLKSHTCNNLFDLHPPRIFQIDGNLGAVAGIAEMLVQSHMDEIRLLPALPKAWSSGCFNGLCARGAITIDMNWDDGRPTYVRLIARHNATIKLRLPGEEARTVELKANAPLELRP